MKKKIGDLTLLSTLVVLEKLQVLHDRKCLEMDDISNYRNVIERVPFKLYVYL